MQIPVLADITWNGTPLKVMLWANRNGNFYVLDRATGKFLLGKPFVKVNWVSGFDERGRPIQTPQPPGMPTCPGDPGRHELVLAVVQPAHRAVLHSGVGRLRARSSAGRRSSIRKGGASAAARTGPTCRSRAPTSGPGAAPAAARSTTGPKRPATARCIALDPTHRRAKWKFAMTDVTDSGILTTASDLLFTGGREGYFQALDARTGTLLWKTNLGGQIVNGPITYEVDGKQYVATIAGLSLCVFSLRD